LAILDAIGASPADFFATMEPEARPVLFQRALYATSTSNGIDVHFDYSHFDAVYSLADATLEDFDAVVGTLRERLASGVAQTPNSDGDSETSTAIKSAAVEKAFWEAMHRWPKANPTDIWGFVIARGFLDPFNHPATSARGDLAQSWKRTGGWALERILVTQYGPYLATKGVHLSMPPLARKNVLLDMIRKRVTTTRLEADKVDVFLSGDDHGTEVCFGVVHVKNSFAERRTDDVAMSSALVAAGYVSPLWTMDCKSWPGPHPQHTGELGKLSPAPRSAKRKDIEDDLYFSACFSYNRRTLPTPADANTKGRIYSCDLSNPDDDFSKYIIEEWRRFRA
jgi:hypothetical protein